MNSFSPVTWVLQLQCSYRCLHGVMGNASTTFWWPPPIQDQSCPVASTCAPYPHSTCHYNRWIPLARAQDWQPVLDDWTLPERSITGSVKAGRTFGWIGFGGTFPKTIPTQPFGVIPLATGVLSGAFPGRSLSTMPLGFVQTLSWALEATWGPGLLGRLRRAEEPTAQQGITQKRGQWTETGAALSTGTEAGDDDTPGAESNAEDGLGRSEEEPGCTSSVSTSTRSSLTSTSTSGSSSLKSRSWSFAGKSGKPELALLASSSIEVGCWSGILFPSNTHWTFFEKVLSAFWPFYLPYEGANWCQIYPLENAVDDTQVPYDPDPFHPSVPPRRQSESQRGTQQQAMAMEQGNLRLITELLRFQLSAELQRLYLSPQQILSQRHCQWQLK